MSDDKRELLRKLLAAKANRPDDHTPIRRRRLREGPASAGQRRIWLAHQADPTSPAYHIPLGLEWTLPLDVDLLARCLGEVVRRHEALRTVFEWVDDDLVQRVLDPPEIRVPVCVLPPGQDPAAVWRASASAQFDLATGPLLRAEVFRQNGRADVVVVTMHHIASDGWSVGLFTRELAALYRGDADLPEPDRQYLDYAVWERERLATGGFAADLAHWERELATGPTAPLFPGGPAKRSGGGRITRLDLEPELVSRLRALAAQENATLFMVALAAFAVVLARHSGEDDIPIGTATSGRDHPAVAGVVGFLVNTVVLRTNLGGLPDFTELLTRVRTTCTAAFGHQQVPFDQVVDHLRPDRDSTANPFFQAFFTHQSGNLLAPAGDHPFRPVGVDLGVAGFELAVTLDDAVERPHFIVEYSTDLFDDRAVAALLADYHRTLRAVVAQPHRRVHLIPLGERPEPRPFPRPAESVPDSFERQAALTPDALAVFDGTTRVTYAELDQRANDLAWRLREHGAGPDVLVAVCLDRGIELMVAILAVLKSGAAYVPLDPVYPVERLAYVLADTAVSAVVTRRPEVLPLLDAPVLDIGHARRADPPDRPWLPDSLAYVLYTSGSTGRPKGAMVQHGALAGFCRAVADRFALGPRDRFLQFASISFDVAAEEIWPTWLSGGAVVLLPDGPPPPGAEFTDVLGARDVTVVELPTAYWHEWSAELDRTGTVPPPCLRLVVIGGERVLPDRLISWQRTGIPLAHVYGLTETTVTSTVQGPMPVPDRAAQRANLPIGTPLANAEVHVLDRYLNPAPTGVAGEVHIGGPGVGRGYLGRPDLTADRFIPNPFSATPGERLYRTGDRARVLPDGALEFLGRLDDQVKIRGFRVEPAETAVVLAEHPLVRDAVVVDREHARGGRHLVGYVTPAGDRSPDPDDLVAFQHARLPAYMVAEVVAVIAELPLNHNGKVDKRRLPPVSAATVVVEPATPAEELLCAVWADVLGVDRVGARDDFFRSGGDSITAIRLVAAAAAAGLRITPRQLFEHRTPAGVARVARPVSAADQGEVTGSAPLTPIQRWFFAHDGVDRRAFVIPVELDVAVSPDVVRDALDALLRHHDALRTRFVDGADGVRQEFPATVADPPLVVVDLSGDPDRDATRRRLMADTAAGIDLEIGRLVRALLTVEGDGRDSRLFLVVHHLVCDAVSLRILVRDLASACAARHVGEPVVFPPKSTSFLDWARRVDRLAQAPGTTAESAYWKSVVDAPAARVPRDHPGGANSEAAATTLDTHLAVDLRGGLRIGPVEVLLTALAATLTSWSGGDVLVELEGHGREEVFPDVDLSRTVGWFTTTYPVLLPSRDTGVAAHVRAVKDVVRGVPRNGFGHLLLRDAPASPAEVAFNYLGRWDGFDEHEELVRPARRPDGWRPTSGDRPHLIEVTAAEVRGQLRISWVYSREVHRPETIAGLAATLLREVESVLVASRDDDAVTPSDFPLVTMDPALLGTLPAAREVDAVLPPTPGQEAALRLTAAVADRTAHVMHSAYALSPAVDAERLRAAWDAVLARHVVLRSGFRRGVQVVHRAARAPWHVRHLPDLRWADLSDGDRSALLEAAFDEHEQLADDLAAAPLMRLRLLVLADLRLLVWSYHHLLLDGWSDGLVLGEVAEHHDGKRPSDIGDDLAAWEELARRTRREPSPGRSGALLPGPRGWHREVLDEATARRLGESSRREGVTVAALLHGAWARLLADRTGTSEVAFGASVTGRTADVPGIEAMVGAFAVIVPVRLTAPEPRDPWAWAREAQRVLVEAQNGDALDPGSSAAGGLSDSTVFAYENFPTTAGGPAAPFTHVHSRQERVWPLMLMVIPEDGGLSLVETHDTTRFDAAVVRDLVAAYRASLEDIAFPERRSTR
ncbi:non-ribosomal peptide synthetase [Saccharothrix deserti]|uniref:non-ribosomal peptide synthetase n=1 Tax=Saccharothrix deserti TaxID=2593674 RepID=UPI00131AE399|nr:non-ribosomal peptide synthetase [Saccharothrix deserti]